MYQLALAESKPASARQIVPLHAVVLDSGNHSIRRSCSTGNRKSEGSNMRATITGTMAISLLLSLLLHAQLTDVLLPVSALSTPARTAKRVSPSSLPPPSSSSPLFGRDGIFARRRTALSISTYRRAGGDGGEAQLREERSFNPGPEITFGSSGLKMNWYGAIYGTIAIAMGIVWWLALTACQLLYKLFGVNKVDANRILPVYASQLWGESILRSTGCYPKITGRENIAHIFKSNKGKKGGDRTPIMFCANHVSWMDIPFVAVAIGWRNYKIIAKQELLKVPILSKSLRTADHVILDRSNRRSQMETFKKGVRYLKDGVNLVTFPEGTRSRDGRMGSFKLGAFKMAQREGAPIVPLSIRYAHKVQPIEYVWPVRPGQTIPASIHIGKPISTDGKTDEELTKEVWDAISENLPKSQQPLPTTPVSVK